MEADRKLRRKKAAEEKRETAAAVLQLKKDRTKKRRARMLTEDLRDPHGDAVMLYHQPSSVVRLY
jgi:hypothetical protein